MGALHSLRNSSRSFQKKKRVGRGMGSKLGKTCGRGHKGAGSRSGWKSRIRYEGGQLPLYRKFPVRGFSNARFTRRFDVINLDLVSTLFEDGEVVTEQSLREKGFLKGFSNGIKLLGNGELTKKLSFEVHAVSGKAKEKLDAANISYKIV